MKKIFRLSASSLLAVFTISCSSLEIKEDIPAVILQDCGFCAQNGPASAKTHIGMAADDSATVNWDNGDALTVFSKSVGSPSNQQFGISNIQGSTADFSGKIEETTTDFVAVYPYNSAASYSTGKIYGYTIPAAQTAKSGSFVSGTAISMANGTRTPGVSECGTLNFKNLCSIISFTLPTDITFAKSVTVTAKGGAKMAGEVVLDVEKENLSDATVGEITLSGTFAADSTYYVLVAPGAYSGFTFKIDTNGGNSYTRETTKSFTAAAGEIYPLGKLSLALTSADFNSSVTISHTVESGVLTGSKAVFSLNPKTEFASAIKHYNVTVSLLKGSNICRSLSYDSDSEPSAEEMTIANNQYYLQSGDYVYSASVIYTVNNGTKDILRTVNLIGNVSSGSPSGFAIGADLSGFTSYSCYKGLDGQTASVDNANNCDKETIYGIGASYKSGLSADVFTQCGGSLLTVKSTLDGVETEGSAGGQSWGVHTIGATWDFDGVVGTYTDTKSVYVSGLPLKDDGTLYNTASAWTMSGNNAWRNDSYLELWIGGSATSKAFVLPESVNVNVNARFKLYSGSFKSSGKIVVGGTTIADETYKTFSGYQEYTPSSDISISNDDTVYLEGYAHMGTATYAVAVAQFFSVNVIYR